MSTKQQIRLDTVHMDYPGRLISKNHLWHGGNRRFGMNAVAKRWKGELVESLAWLLIAQGIQRQGLRLVPPVLVTIGGSFVDKGHAPDLHNLAELIADSVQEAIGINDRYFELSTEAAAYGVDVPEVRVTVTLTVEG